MTAYIVPNELSDLINKKLDEAYANLPPEEKELAIADRNFHYSMLLHHFIEDGVVPDFSLVKNPNETR